MPHSQYSHISDEDLIRDLLGKKNDILFELLYERYFDKIYYQCLGYVKSPSIAKDLTQETFLRVHDKLSQFQFKSSFSTWLFQVTRRMCLDFLRRDPSQREEDFGPQNDEAIPHVSDEELMSLEAWQLKVVLDELPVTDKEILMMMYANEWQMDEIAEVLEIGLGAVKMRLKRAKARVVDLHNKIHGK